MLLPTFFKNKARLIRYDAMPKPADKRKIIAYSEAKDGTIPMLFMNSKQNSHQKIIGGFVTARENPMASDV